MRLGWSDRNLRPRAGTAMAMVTAICLAACAAPTDRSQLADGSLDGRYVGTRTEDPACGTSVHSISFEVLGSAISVHSRRKSSRLRGTVGRDGQIALQNASGGGQVSGSITNGMLTATETVAPPSGRGRHNAVTGLDDPLALPCTWRYQASRIK